MGRKINIRPTSSVYATYKRLSYQPWTALAEFVDNSTQSFYDHKEELMSTKYYDGLVIEIDYNEDAINGDSLIIRDNAYGMEWQDFQRAVILDRPPKNTSGRNEFGMGLKTAACWFGSLWSVESTQLNSKNKYYIEIDTDELGKYKTEEIDVKEQIVNNKEHFTQIVIRNLNKRIRGARTIGKVKELLSSIYRQDLRSGLVKIYYNGNLLQFKEPPIYVEEIDGMEKEWKKEVDFSVDHEGKELNVSGFIAIRIPGSVKDAGFTLLRRGRVIVGGSDGNYRPSELFGDSNSYAWQRLYGELNMDNWPVTQAKDNFDWHNSGLEEAFINALEPLTQEYRRKAEDIRVRKRVKSHDLVHKAFDDLENLGIVKNVSMEIEDEEQQNAEQIQDTTTEKTDSNELHDKEDENEDIATNDNDGVIVEGGRKVNYTFKYKKIEYIFHIILDTDNPNAQWLLVESQSDYEYTIYINMVHPFFKPLIEMPEFLSIMMRVAIAMILAEIESLKLSPDGKIEAGDIRLKMNDILKNIQRGDEEIE